MTISIHLWLEIIFIPTKQKNHPNHRNLFVVLLPETTSISKPTKVHGVLIPHTIFVPFLEKIITNPTSELTHHHNKINQSHLGFDLCFVTG